VVAHRPLAGAGISLPAACAGAILPGVDFPCARDASVACWGPVVAADGHPVVALVVVCAMHARPAMAYLKRSTPNPGDIEAWGLENFIEAQGMIRSSGIDLHVLTAAAA
jgi:hypothetical protein